MLENEFPGANIILHKLSKLPQASGFAAAAVVQCISYKICARYVSDNHK